MLFNSKFSKLKLVAIFATLIFLTGLLSVSATKASSAQAQSYIISAKSLSQLKANLKQLGVTPSHELKVIDSVAVSLTPAQLKALEKKQKIKASINHKVELSGRALGQRRWQPNSVVNQQVDAHYIHNAGNYGGGVTIGFLDTGLDQLPGLSTDLYGRDKAWGTYDAINDIVSNYDDEASGHGTHVASIATNSDYDSNGRIYGIAPNAAHVGIKAFDAEGKATYADVIRGIDWALQVKEQINLRVLNMSFSGPIRSNYWDDPLNRAVMKLWQAGIVVVASAGNSGPDPMSIGVPGNVPYIITVGAMTDDYSAFNYYDDKVASFSSAGPTPEGFVKPDVIAPGGHVSGLMSFDAQIATQHPEFHDGGRYFEMSGTSQAAAVVSGVVALLLTDDPSLSPDQVKCRILDGAYRALNEDGSLRYSVFQQGAGLVSAYNSISSQENHCANTHLDIAKDLNDEQHFSGPANINQDGHFYVEGLGDEFVWNLAQEQVNGDALIWRMSTFTHDENWNNTASTDALIWRMNFETNALIWRMSVESNALIWRMSLAENEVATININNWVSPE
ncbi:serine protease AprX [Colwellia chukchiensis]|uniref:Serine protease AprX n=1 Tax=Colwellia chukchiensis TaxID=641665 RepID=A0A1H7UB52_9GAMM|nr:S8 family peptidase [Colwellia chukchiensis]SEL94300.1 serine protease AprX [Colwellia chukchiensis]